MMDGLELSLNTPPPSAIVVRLMIPVIVPSACISRTTLARPVFPFAKVVSPKSMMTVFPVRAIWSAVTANGGPVH